MSTTKTIPAVHLTGTIATTTEAFTNTMTGRVMGGMDKNAEWEPRKWVHVDGATSEIPASKTVPHDTIKAILGNKDVPTGGVTSNEELMAIPMRAGDIPGQNPKASMAAKVLQPEQFMAALTTRRDIEAIVLQYAIMRGWTPPLLAPGVTKEKAASKLAEAIGAALTKLDTTEAHVPATTR